MERLRNMFGGGDDSNQPSQDPESSSSQRQDDESASLINTSAQGVFSRGAEAMESLDTGPDYTIAAGFLFFAVLFFLAALTSLPMILLSPRSFNLYFCFGSIFLQCALAFYYSPMQYLKSMFSPENRLVSGVYIGSLLLSLYFIYSGSSYFGALFMVALQAFALFYYVSKAVAGADRANSWAYNLLFASIVSRLRGGGGDGSKGYTDLPI